MGELPKDRHNVAGLGEVERRASEDFSRVVQSGGAAQQLLPSDIRRAAWRMYQQQYKGACVFDSQDKFDDDPASRDWRDLARVCAETWNIPFLS